jgi:hypothetical protein
MLYSIAFLCDVMKVDCQRLSSAAAAVIASLAPIIAQFPAKRAPDYRPGYC